MREILSIVLLVCLICVATSSIQEHRVKQNSKTSTGIESDSKKRDLIDKSVVEPVPITTAGRVCMHNEKPMSCEKYDQLVWKEFWTDERVRRFNEDSERAAAEREKYRISELNERIADMDRYISTGKAERADTLEAVLQKRAEIAAGGNK